MPELPRTALHNKGGDWLSVRLSPIVDGAGWRNPSGRRISPLVGEMFGRTEGGAGRHLEGMASARSLDCPVAAASVHCFR